MLVHLQYKHKPEYDAVLSKATTEAGTASRLAQAGQRSLTAAFKQLDPIPRG